MAGEMGVAVGERPGWLPRRLYPFESRFVEVEGCRVHYVDEGSGPALLMLHGNPTWSFLYRGIIQRLRDRFRCVALDYPGFGLSTAAPGYDFRPATHARIVEQFVLGLDLRELTPVMQDWGGPIGLAVAERHPERIQALVIANTWAWPVMGDRRFERFSKLLGGRAGGFFIRRFNAFVNLLVPVGVRHKVPREVMTAYRQPLATPARREATHVFPREILASREFLATVESSLPRLQSLPALIVWGDRDMAFREKERRHFERLFPDHRTVVLRGAGHFLQEDAPAEVASAIGAWWAQSVAPRLMPH